ncbi:MAG TPA: DNA-directed RNA polymerase subunit A' [Candidatus Acidoferrum sp.]|nr:DNA-directed RNA polymerase subunit A' [Candidatus Acidoferrum sp.]
MQAESIEFVKFTTLSPELIKRMSVAKLIVSDTYNEDGYPIDGGVVDQRLGVIDPGLKCKTCGGRAKSCPGHFGHIELVRPVIHPEFAKTIYLLLQSTCEKCYRILLSENQIAEVRPAIAEFVKAEGTDELIAPIVKEVDKKSPMMKRLKSVKKCPHCGSPQRKIKLERPTLFYVEGNRIRPDEMRDWLSKISNDDLSLMGIDPIATRPEWLVITTLLVPPVNVRPSITLESGERSEDDLTHKLVDIMRINQRLGQDIDAGAPQIIIDDLWELLQYQVTTYFNNETPGIPVARHRSTRPLKTLAQRLKGKEGRLRYNLSGKRVNFSARTVICSDSKLTINEVGVPTRIAENLTVPIYATQWNIDIVKSYLERTEYPMVLNVISKDGIRKRVSDANREELLKGLVPGFILERQLVDGDLALFNRQPTLHRLSVMAHSVRVLPGKTLRLNTSVAVPYNADFDGDEMNLHVPQSIEAQAEARYLMQPKDSILSPKDGRPIMFTEEDQIEGLYMLTKDDAYFTKDETSIMLSSANVSEMPKKGKNGMYSGKAIFSMILPRNFNYTTTSFGQKVTIKNGELEEGVIGEDIIGFGGSMILEVFEQCGSDVAEKFLKDVSEISERVVYSAGMTISIRDYYETEAIRKEKDRIIKEADDKAAALLENYRQGKLEALPGYTRRETLELEMRVQLDIAREVAARFLQKTLKPDNNAYLMAMVKAKGNILNFVQTSMLLGQQAVRGRRPTRGYTGRILPYFRKNDKRPEARGFIRSSFLEGLTPTELYMHSMGARDSAMTKSLITAVSGYMQRRLINALQDLYISDDASVKDASGALIETTYGGDGLDPMYERISKKSIDSMGGAGIKVARGEAVGVVAAQSIGEPGTQMVLRSFHSAGIASVITTTGLPRIIEIVDARKKPKFPMMEIRLEKNISKNYEKVKEIWKKIEEVKVSSVMQSFEENLKSGNMILHLNKEKLDHYGMGSRTVASRIGKLEGVTVDQDGDVLKIKVKDKEIKAVRTRFVKVLASTIGGVNGIPKVVVQQDDDQSFYLTTSGSNIEGVLQVDGVDKDGIYSNDIFEVMRVYGVEAARSLIANELMKTIEEEGIKVSFRHLSLVADTMTHTGVIKSVGRHGIAGEKESVFARAAYEETVKHFTNASVFGETDRLTGVAENILIGKQICVGTGRVRLAIKKEELKKIRKKD